MTEIAASVLSGLLLYLSFPKHDFSSLSWVALVPLLLVLKNRKAASAFGLSLLCGLVFSFGLFFWVTTIVAFKWFHFLAWISFVSFFIALFGLILSVLENKWRIAAVLVAPALWVALEYLRSHASFIALPWALLGHSQYRNIPLIQISAYTGVYGISFVIVMTNIAVRDLVLWGGRTVIKAPAQRKARQHPGRFPIAAVLAVSLALLLVFGYGAAVLSRPLPSAGEMAVTVIQGNYPTGGTMNQELQRRIMKTQERLTEDATREGPSTLIVWPEGAVDGFLREDPVLYQTVASLAAGSGAHFLVGSTRRPKFGPAAIRKGRYFNSAFLVAPDGRFLGQYNKMRLLPFSEYVPFEGKFSWPSWLFSANDKYFVPGSDFTVFKVGDGRFGAPICWENVFPDHVSAFVRRGANFIVNITNEAWFGDTAGPYQFLSMSVFRAVENRIAVVRAANSGVSCFIDPHGRIAGRVHNGRKDIFVEGHRTEKIPFRSSFTFYTTHGDVFAYLSLIATAGFVTALCAGWKRSWP